jgi:DeoR/GlpR family transcriptional regulator of sugar metabolism
VTGEVIDQSTRWRMLLDALSIHKRLSVTEAAELLGVPVATVRRDFEELARQQLATRTRVWARKGQRNVPRDTDPSSRRWKITYTISTGTTVMTTAAKSAPKSTA